MLLSGQRTFVVCFLLIKSSSSPGQDVVYTRPLSGSPNLDSRYDFVLVFSVNKFDIAEWDKAIIFTDVVSFSFAVCQYNTRV